MQQHPTIQDVADHFEQLLIRIMLAVISQLIDELVGFKDENEVEFWASGETESGSAGEQPDKG